MIETRIDKLTKSIEEVATGRNFQTAITPVTLIPHSVHRQRSGRTGDDGPMQR